MKPETRVLLVVALAARSALGFDYVGCYTDSEDSRDLPTQLSGDVSSAAQCASLCACAGYAFAGVQYGSECYCGDAYGSAGESTECSDACSADDDDACGGYYCNSIYAVDGAADCKALPCASKAAEGWVWCDASRPLDERVAALVANLTTDEKAGLFTDYAEAVPRLALPE